MANDKNKGGRPTKYKKEYNNQAFELCLLGCTNEELAEYFDVDPATIYRWINEYKEFRDTVNLAKLEADAKVAKALYSRALGCTVKKQQAVKIKIGDTEEIQIVDLETELPPDVGAAKFWLTNRQRSKWKDRQDEDEQTEGKVTTLVLNINTDGTPDLPDNEDDIIDSDELNG